jgi:uncharacterized membrane protein YbhN (UPF0104 family)
MSLAQRAHAAGKKLPWQKIRKVLVIALPIAVLALLGIMARRLEWDEVWQALRNYNATTLGLAALAMCASYLIYSSYDLIGRRHTGHTVPRRKVLLITFVCYAFTQSFTAWVGGIAMRYRLYTRHGLSKSVVAQIFTISLLTNWIGYIALACALAAAGFAPIPEEWPIGHGAMRLVGVVLLLVPVVYLYCCHRYAGHKLTLFDHEWRPLGLRTGALQVVLGAANWSMMGAVIFVLLHQQVPYPTVLAILLLSSVAAVIVHVPAGLGVLEALFIALLQGDMNRSEVMAALIGYRAIYFLLPLLPALLIYLFAEWRSHRGKVTPARQQAPGSRR